MKTDAGSNVRWLTRGDRSGFGHCRARAKQLANREGWPRREDKDGQARIGVSEDQLQKWHQVRASPGWMARDLIANGELDRFLAELAKHPLAKDEVRELKAGVFVAFSEVQPEGLEYAFSLTPRGRTYSFQESGGWQSRLSRAPPRYRVRRPPSR